MFAYALASKPCSEATNKDSFISRGLFFGWNKIRIHGGRFGDYPEDCGVSFPAANQNFRARIYLKELDKAVCKIFKLLYNK